MGRVSLGLGSEGWANAIPVARALIEHPPILLNVHVPLRAKQHQVSIIAEVSVPLDHLVVAPGRRILLHLIVRHSIEISPQIHVSLVQRLGRRLLLEVPDWLLHAQKDPSNTLKLELLFGRLALDELDPNLVRALDERILDLAACHGFDLVGDLHACLAQHL